MKAFYLIIITLLTHGLSFAQQDLLISNDWELQNVTINGVEYLPPTNNNEINSPITASFNQDEFYTSVCNYLWSVVSYNDDDGTFSFTETNISLIECHLPENATFEDIYFTQFYNPFVGNPIYHYTIEDRETHLILTVTNSIGNHAVYIASDLSDENVALEDTNFQVYPNPVKNKLFINLRDVSKDCKAIFTNNLGQIILRKKLSETSTSLNLNQLVAGTYYLTIYNQKSGQKSSKIIIKE